ASVAGGRGGGKRPPVHCAGQPVRTRAIGKKNDDGRRLGWADIRMPHQHISGKGTSGAQHLDLDKLNRRARPAPAFPADQRYMAKRNQRPADPRLNSPSTEVPVVSPDHAPSPVRKKSRRGPRTASGKKADPSTLADAGKNALEGLRERTEQGHLKAGRTPPSQAAPLQIAGATRQVDDAI